MVCLIEIRRSAWLFDLFNCRAVSVQHAKPWCLAAAEARAGCRVLRRELVGWDCSSRWSVRPGPPTAVLLGLVPAYSDEHHHRPSRPLLRLDKGRLCWRPMGNDHLELRLDRWTSLYKSTPRRYFPPILCAFFPILLTLFSWRDRLCRIWGRLLPIWVVVSIRQRT